MNFRGRYTNSLIQAKGRLLRRKIIQDCDAIFIALAWAVFMSMFC